MYTQYRLLHLLYNYPYIDDCKNMYLYTNIHLLIITTLRLQNFYKLSTLYDIGQYSTQVHFTIILYSILVILY